MCYKLQFKLSYGPTEFRSQNSANYVFPEMILLSSFLVFYIHLGNFFQLSAESLRPVCPIHHFIFLPVQCLQDATQRHKVSRPLLVQKTRVLSAQYPTYTKMALITVFLPISSHCFQHAIYCIDLFLQIFMFNSLRKSWNEKISKFKSELLKPFFKRMLNVKTYQIQFAKTHI